MTGKEFRLIDTQIDESRETVTFHYELETDESSFDLTESLIFPSALPDTKEVEALIRALHLMLAISYYKAFVPPQIRHPYAMDSSEAEFWNSVWRKGLGEFMYRNSLDSAILAKFAAQDGVVSEADSTVKLQDSALLGIGGGKDSIVAGELLKIMSMPLSGFVMGTADEIGQAQAVADVMGINLLIVKRRIDKQIIEMNNLPGAMNGHIPISAVFALVGSLLAASQGCKYVVVANEASASIPQASWENEDVNHQWSKSIEFERKYQNYLRSFVSPDLCYFSAIRPLSSVAVAKLFSEFPAYFEVFSSDNSLLKIRREGHEHPRWSLNSSKSLSSFILLSAWLSEDQLISAFGRNFLDQAELENLFIALLGKADEPVLDCVGTPAELRASLSEAIAQNKFKDSRLVKIAVERNLLSSDDTIHQHMDFHEHALPAGLGDKLIKIMKDRI